LARLFENLRESFNARLLFSKSRDYKPEYKFSTLKNGSTLNNGYKADIFLGWKHSFAKLKSRLNGYFESRPEKEINLKWLEWKSLTEMNGLFEVRI